MRSARTTLTSSAKASLLSGDIERMRVEASLDMLLTRAIVALAVGMALGYLVLRRLGPHSAASR